MNKFKPLHMCFFDLPRKQAGLSLIEIMVAMMIGMFSMIVVMQVFANSEAQKRTATGGSDAVMSANIAMFQMARDARMAGYGIIDTSALGCAVSTSYAGSTTVPGTFTLAPAVITSGGASADQVTFLSSTTREFSLPAQLTVAHAQTDTAATMLSTWGMAVNDLVVFFESGKACALAQITSFPSGGTGVTTFNHTGGSWNDTSILPASGYLANTGKVFNLGDMSLRTYRVNTANNTLEMVDVSRTSAPSTVNVVASDIVNMKVQYGKDADNNGVIETWDTTAPATAAGWAQVRAVKIALVARSGQYEKPSVAGGACEATTATSANAPVWSGGGATALTVPGGYPSCYRYKVVETTVPFRNIIWQ